MVKKKSGQGFLRFLYFLIVGLTPMLQHNPSAMVFKRGVHSPTTPSPEEEAAAGRYLLPDGNFCVPANAVRASMLKGARGLRSGKFSLKSILAGAITTGDELFPLLRNGKPIAGNDYSIDIRRAVVQGQGILRARAKIELPWEVECVFGFNPVVIPDLEVIRLVLQNAGTMAGLLDYRPGKAGKGEGGWFGKYEPREIWTE